MSARMDYHMFALLHGCESPISVCLHLDGVTMNPGTFVLCVHVQLCRATSHGLLHDFYLHRCEAPDGVNSIVPDD